MIKRKGIKKVPTDLEDDNSYSWLSDKPSISMQDGEIISPREYKKRFDLEWYAADFYNGEDTIINNGEGKSEAIRMKNSLDRDALSAAEKTGSLFRLNEDEREFMEEASNEWEWRDAYKTLGYRYALTLIIEQTVKDLENKKIKPQITLSRFIIKVLNLRKLHYREKKKR